MATKKKTTAQTAPETHAVEATTPEGKYNVVLLPAEPSAPEAEPTGAPAPKKKVKAKAVESSEQLAAIATGPTLQAACDGYIASMEDAGNSTSTVASYKMDLRVALDELGAETSLAEITPEMVATYFASMRVTQLKSGQPKAKASVDKTRRVLRLALAWAQDQGLIERAPLPEPATRSNGSGAR